MQSNFLSSVQQLSFFLANTYALLLKTQTYHWNVHGDFVELHQLFQDQYENLFEAVDELAERIRMLGHPVVASFQNFSNLSVIQETSSAKEGQEMVSNLLKDHQTLVEELKKSLMDEEMSQDFGTQDLLTERLRFHEKAAWMLRSSLKD